MKRVVNIFELLIVLAIIYPIYYIWQTDKVEEFCGQVASGMTVDELSALAKEQHVTLSGPTSIDPLGAQWRYMVSANIFISDFFCEIKGAGKTVAIAELVKQ